MSKETYVHGKRAPFVSKETYAHGTNTDTAMRACTSGRRDLRTWKQQPIYMATETYAHATNTDAGIPEARVKRVLSN